MEVPAPSAAVLPKDAAVGENDGPDPTTDVGRIVAPAAGVIKRFSL
jgi:hypothetical protein